MCFVFQSEKVGLEGECRAKDLQLAVREAEVKQIPALKNELEKLRVRISKIIDLFKVIFLPPLPQLPRSPPSPITDREEWYGGGMSREG